ncbi:MAG: hypothetical protein R3C52_07640 [Hyphomonadaceae bacterium]
MDIETITLPDLPDWLVVVLWVNVAAAAIWIVLTLFVYMRRRASNLTPVNAPHARKDAAPDFLSVDHKAREAQIERGEAFESELDKREAEEAARAAGVKKISMWRRLAGFATFLISLFSLASSIVGVIWQVDRIGGMMSQADKIGVILQKYPIPFAVAAFVIGYYVIVFFAKKQWKRAS